MKIWIKDKRYKIQERKDGWLNVYFEDKVIATVMDEYNARIAIYKHCEEKEYVFKCDFEDWGDNEFKYPQSVKG